MACEPGCQACTAAMQACVYCFPPSAELEDLTLTCLTGLHMPAGHGDE